MSISLVSRRVVLALVVFALPLFAAIGAPSAAQTNPVVPEPQWLRGTWGSQMGRFGLVAARLGDGDPDLEWVAAATAEGAEETEPNTWNDMWYVIDSDGAGGFEQVQRSALYPAGSGILHISSLTAADVDQDGVDEILVAYENTIEIWDGWPLTLDRTVSVPGSDPRGLQVADVDVDGTLELVYCGDLDGNLHVIDAVTGASELVHPQFCTEIAVANLDGDPALEIAIDPGQVIDGGTGVVEHTFQNGLYQVVAAELDGTAPAELVSTAIEQVWVHRWQGGSSYSSTWLASGNPIDTLRAGDLFNADGIDEIIVGEADDNGLVIYDGTSSIPLDVIPNPLFGVRAVLVAPLDDTPGADLLWSTGGPSPPDATEAFFLYDPSSFTFKWRTHDASGPFHGLAVGDVDADGTPEVVYGSRRSNGKTAPGRYFIHDLGGALEYAGDPIGIGEDGIHRVTLAQLDGDPQLEVLVATTEGASGTIPKIKVYDGVTHAEEAEYVGPEHNNFQNVAVADVDQDGALEVVVTTGWLNGGAAGSGFIVFDAATGAVEWTENLDFTAYDYPLLAIGNLDGDSGLEIVVGQDGNLTLTPDVHIFDGITRFEEWWSDTHRVTSLEIEGGLSGNPGKLWAGELGGDILLFNSTVGEFAFETGWSGPIHGLNLYDVTLDGFDDLVFVGGAELVVLDGETYQPVASRVLQGNDIGRRDSVLVDDFDGDGSTEFLVNLGNEGLVLLGPPSGPVPGVPTVTIQQPSVSPFTLNDIEEIVLDATATDDEDGDLTWAVQWFSDLDGQVATSNPAYITLSVGSHRITARATDFDGNTGEASTLVNVLSTAPTATIQNPPDGSRVAEGVSFELAVSAVDQQDGDLSAAAVFTSDQVGFLGYGPTFRVENLPRGLHVLTAEVTDLDGRVGTDSVTVEVVDPAECGPGAALDEDFEGDASGWLTTGLWHLAADTSCTSPGWTSPIHSFYFGDDNGCSFNGGGGIQTGDLISPPFLVGTGAALTFSSLRQVEGGGGTYDQTEVLIRPLGGTWTSLWLRTSSDPSSTAWATEGPISLTPWEGVTVELRFRFDTVDSAVNDFLGWLVDDVQVSGDTCLSGNTPPTVTILDPADGSTIPEQFTLVGSVTDPDETNPGDFLDWYMDTVHYLGRGSSLPVNLPAGERTLEARYTDSAGVTASQTVDVIVFYQDQAPTVVIDSPVDGAVYPSGAQVTLAGSADDPEDGDLTAQMEWFSDRDGPLAIGGFSPATLSDGVHLIVAEVGDSYGNMTQTSVTVTIEPNTPPVIQILEPTAVEFEEGQNVSFRADATDAEDGDLTADLEWASSLDGPLGMGYLVVTTPSAGTHTIYAQVSDSAGATTQVDFQISVQPNAPPTLTIMNSDGEVVLEGTTVALTANADDSLEGDLSEEIQWLSDLDGPLGIGSTVFVDLSRGLHTILADVTDGFGNTAQESITLRVNGAPEITVLSPSDGTVWGAGDAQTFSAAASDAEDGSLDADVVWTSNVDGQLHVGPSFTADLSPGVHAITASVTDRHGATATDGVMVTFDPPPTVAISAPTDGVTVSANGPVTFTATASDAQDGDLTAAVVWVSDRDGKIGYGGTFTRRLSAGTHGITATVTDSSAETATVTLTLTVEPAPTVTMAPGDGGHALPGDPALLEGEAVGTDGSDLSASIAWSSDLDGPLGTGAFIGPMLSTGVHVIIATVTDGLGRTGTATGRLFVTSNAPPLVHVSAPLDRAWCTGAPCAVPLTATAYDPEDGDLTATGVWTSDLEGALDADGDGVATLGLGVHTLTYSVTDTAGNTFDRSVLFRVLDTNDATPVVTVIDPADGSTAKDGDPVTLDATAFDGDLGTVSEFVEWTLLPAGTALGTGTRLDLTAGDELPVGTHTLRARLVDGARSGEATVTLTVEANPAPEVSITFPADGSTVVQGDPVALAAVATDEEDGDLTAQIAWTSNLDGALGTGSGFDVDSSTLTVGTHTLTAAAIDSRGATGTASVTLTVVANDAPTLSVTSPADGARFVQGDAVSFIASAADTQDGDLTAGIAWSSDLDGALGTGGYFDVDSLALTIGTHVLTAAVTDANGATTSASVNVTVEANDPPVVTVTAPADGVAVLDTDAVTFTVVATDAQDGDVSDGVTWSSDRDGPLGTGAGFVTSNLSVGLHTITARTWDSQGLEGSAAVTVTVHRAPTVTISAPADGTSAVETDPVTFAASASDPDDGDLTASITWTSDRDGPLGTGGSVTTSALSVGSHTVTASVTDSHGVTRTDTVTVTVAANTVPSVTVTAPAEAARVTLGDPVTFTATAVDAQDGDLSAAVAWTSSRDGALGTGGSVTTSSLSVGTHTVTATVADRHGAGASASVTLTVRPQPVTVSFLSNGAEDGWILESSENSGTGGAFESLESGGKNRDYETIRVGDDRKDEQYRSILSFDTSAIPDGAEIRSVTVRLRRGSLAGQNPFATHGDLVVDIKNGAFGTPALEASDFQAAADATAAAILSQPAADGDDAVGSLDAAGRAAVNAAGRTQLRLRFVTDDDDDRSPDVLGFYAGETSSPQVPELVVTYQE